MNTVKIQQRGLITLPKNLRDALALEEGQILSIKQSGQKIILEAKTNIDSDLATALAKSLDDIKKGNFIEFGSTKEFHKKLKGYAN
jgi:AbrB family looped-hinge helix DNA binding protein